jgi:hypothetical protein
MSSLHPQEEWKALYRAFRREWAMLCKETKLSGELPDAYAAVLRAALSSGVSPRFAFRHLGKVIKVYLSAREQEAMVRMTPPACERTLPAWARKPGLPPGGHALWWHAPYARADTPAVSKPPA